MPITSFEICKMFGIKPETFSKWVKRGFIIPSVQKVQGRRTKNLFSDNDISTIILFRKLLDLGIRREKASEYIRDRKKCKKLISTFNSLFPKGDSVL